VKVVVDTNIIFSGLLNPNGKIADLLINSSNTFEFYSPTFILDELETHQDKLLKISKLTEKELKFLKRIILRNITLLDVYNLPIKTRQTAFDLAKEIDEKDTPFVALSIELNCCLWTGDKKLITGLRKKGLDLALDTEAVFNIRKNI
jgi:putative PIN family toxin of toxin-antitoxin system